MKDLFEKFALFFKILQRMHGLAGERGRERGRARVACLHVAGSRGGLLNAEHASLGEKRLQL